MSIATQIAALQADKTAIATAITNKGGTVNSGDGFDDFAADISTIPSGGGSQTKYGADVGTFLGDVDANGVLQLPTEQSDLVFTGVKKLSSPALYYKFAYSKVKSVSFPDLEEATTGNCLAYAFHYSGVKTASFPKLTTIDYATHLFQNCPLESVSMPNLTTITGGTTGRGLTYAFYTTQITELDFPELTDIIGATHTLSYLCNNCSKLETVRFSKLSTIPTKSSTANSCFYYAFASDNALKDIYFNAVNSNTFTGGYPNVFNGMFSNTSGRDSGCTVHFPSNMQSIISGLNGYPTFGGSANYITIAFDLPATS